jgi:hypothetical protein
MKKKSNVTTFSTHESIEKNDFNETSIAFFWAIISVVALLFFVFGA